VEWLSFSATSELVPFPKTFELEFFRSLLSNADQSLG
jgi:hypothetical protein